MAAETVQSTYLSNRDAKPQVPNTLFGLGRPFRKVGSVAATTGKTNPSYYGFFDIPSSAYVRSVELSCAALSTSTTMDLGCYETTQYPGSAGAFASVIAGGIANSTTNPLALTNTHKCWGSAIDVSAALAKSQEVFANGSFVTKANFDQAVWKMLGFTVDPQRYFDVVGTSEATITAGGQIIVEITYQMQ